MKSKLLTLAAVAVLASSASAANYLVTNVITGDTSDVLLQNSVSDGSTLSNGGIVTIGYFTGGLPSSSVADIALIIAGFTIEHSVLTGSYSADLDASLPGYFQSSILQGGFISSLDGTPDARVGLAVYMLAGNAATLETSTAFALMQVGTIADDIPNEQQYTANPATGVLVGDIGTIGSFTGDSGVANGTFSTLQLSVVPEPSVALLGAFGVLGLLRRRR